MDTKVGYVPQVGDKLTTEIHMSFGSGYDDLGFSKVTKVQTYINKKGIIQNHSVIKGGDFYDYM
ncbi:hypothetical protein [Pseudoalteromonas piscicida]|uniref:hypothetical protein n=1 Tax=Pseudoalteromonas piscicida TaxID=43662 RepID=UPI0030968B28